MIAKKLDDQIEAADKKTADTTFYEFNFLLEKNDNQEKKEIRINLKSHNKKNSFNLQINKI